MQRMMGKIVDDSMVNFYLNPQKYSKSSDKSNKSKVGRNSESSSPSNTSTSRKAKTARKGSSIRKSNNSRTVTRKSQTRSSNQTRRNSKTKSSSGVKKRLVVSGGTQTLATKQKRAPVQQTPIPISFDAREKWPNCVLPIRHQHICGSCWAHAASGVYAHRKCVASGGESFEVMSPDYLVRCNTENYKCVGGWTNVVWKFIEETGLPSDQCVSYRSGYNVVNPCPDMCDDASPIQLQTAVKVLKGASKLLTKTTDIKRSILNEGAVHADFYVFRDFINYKSGIYSVNSTTLVGQHAIQIIGWGEESGQEYWTCINSWGEQWGENGYFRIGVGEGGIATRNVYGPKPKL